MNFSENLINDYQVKGNRTLAKVCRWVALLMFLIGVLNFAGVFVIEGEWMYIVISMSIIIALLPTLVFDVLKWNQAWAQYLVLTSLVMMCGTMYAVLSYHTIIMLVFPLVCASLYSERKWILYVMVISIPMLILSHLAAFYLKVVPDEPRVTSLAELIETQSQETGGHVKRVSEYTRILCEGAGYDKEEVWKVSIASMMHDVGKLMVPSEIIEKPGKLTAEEFEQVKKHVDYGKKMLEKSPGELMQISAGIAYHHHERWDGNGYNHIKGDAIDPYARCVAIADVFDALVSWRPYKKPWTSREAYEEIVAGSGTQFDPRLVEIFKNHFSQFEEVIEEYPESREEVRI